MPNIRPNLSKRLKNYVVVPRPERMMMGHPDGSLYADITNNPYTIWVTGTSGIPEKVIDRFVPPNYGTAVLVGYHLYDMPSRKQVLSYADIYLGADWMGPAVMSHATTHSFGGSDTDWILRERILYVVPVAGENKVSIYPDAKLLPDGTWWWATDPTIADYSSYIPTSGVLVCLIVLDIDGNLAYRTGTPAATRLDLTAANFPTPSMGDSVFVGMYLTAGMTESHHSSGNDDFIPMDQAGAYAGSTSGIISLTTDVVATGPGIAVATIQPGVVDNSKLADMTGPAVKGKETGTGAPEDLSMATLLSMGVGVFGGATEIVNETPDGVITHFTFDNSAYDIWVLVNGVIQKSEDITFTSMTTAFDLAWAPATGEDVRVIRLAPIVEISPLSVDYILVREEQAAGTNGGTFTSGSFQTRTINTEVSDMGSHCSISGNQITLAAGTYRCRIEAPGYYVNRHQAILYNISDSANELVGTSEYSGRASDASKTPSVIVGEFTITSSKIFEVRHRCEVTEATYGFGVAANFGVTEIYTSAEFWKVT